MKLEIELVPKTAWYSNMRKVLSQAEWDKIRKKTYKDYDYKCGICGKGNVQLECHEIWYYDDENNIQTLKGFIALCHKCHMVKHIGLAGILSRKGELDMDELKNHFLRVNNVTIEEFKEHYRQSIQIFTNRSNKEWTTEFGLWDEFVKK